MQVRGFRPVGVAFLLLASVACQGTAAPASGGPDQGGGEPIPIGAIVSSTGNLASFGQDMLAGMQLYVDEVNAEGGIDGRPLELISIDDESKPEQALAAAKRLTEQEDVVAIGGPDSTAVSASAQSYADQAEVPMIGCICLVGEMTPYTFSAFPLLRQMDNQVEFAERNDVTDIGILTQAGALAEIRRTVDVPNLERLGMNVVGFEQLQPTDTDATALLARLRSNGAEQVFLAANGGLAATAVKNFKSLNYPGYLWTWAGNANGAFIDLVADAADVVNVQGLKILVYDELPDSDPAKERLTAFAEAYVEKNDRQPAVYSAVGYDAMLSIGEAIRSAGPDREAIRDALETQELQGLNGTIARSPEEHNGLSPEWLTLRIDPEAKQFVLEQ